MNKNIITHTSGTVVENKKTNTHHTHLYTKSKKYEKYEWPERVRMGGLSVNGFILEGNSKYLWA